MSMEGVALVMVIAVTVEALVEYGKSLFSANRSLRTVLLQTAVLFVSVCLCLLVGADLYGALGITFAWRPIGGVLSGIFAARGANFVSDLVGKLQHN